MSGDALLVEGRAFDAAAVPADTRTLRLYEVRKADLARLAGLERLPLTELELRWVSAPDLSHVPLPPTLESLVVWHSPKLRSLAGIERAPGLDTLVWRDTGALEDASALSRLPALRHLIIEGGMNAAQKVASLGALEGLRLETLILNGVAGAELDLGPVARMTSLERLELHGPSFTPETLALVAAHHPGLYDRLMDLPDYPANLGMRCKTCGGVRKELFLRKRKYLWCPVCEAAGLSRQLAWFRDLVAAARRDAGLDEPPPAPYFPARAKEG